jgi:hypothetical protein
VVNAEVTEGLRLASVGAAHLKHPHQKVDYRRRLSTETQTNR